MRAPAVRPTFPVHPGPGALLFNDQNPFRFEQSAVPGAPQANAGRGGAFLINLVVRREFNHASSEALAPLAPVLAASMARSYSGNRDTRTQITYIEFAPLPDVRLAPWDARIASASRGRLLAR